MPAAPVKGLSQRGLARELGVTENAVRTALETGRITRTPDGSLDPERARREWNASTDPARSRVQPPHTAPRRGKPDRDGDGASAFQRARTHKESALARLRQLDVETRAGKLVDADQVRRRVFTMAREERDAWLNWPARIGPVLASELGVDGPDLTRALERHVRDHLTERADRRMKL